MGNFCEAFGVTKIEAPSTVRKRINKKRAQLKRPSWPKPFVKRSQPESKPNPKRKPTKKQKKPVVCYKCGKTDHKSFQCKTEQTIDVITNKSPKEFLLDLIGQIPDGNMKREYLERLKTLIIEEEEDK